MTEGYSLSREAVMQLQRLLARVDSLEREVKRLSRGNVARPIIDEIQLAKTGESPIAAISGADCGTGTVTVWEVNNEGDYLVTDRTVDAFNPWDDAIPANTKILIGRCHYGHQWIVIGQQC